MKKAHFSYIFFFIGFFLLSQDTEKKTLATGPFIGVKVYSNLEVNLIASDVNKVIAYGDNSDYVVLSIKNKVLKIRVMGGSLLTPGKTKIDIYHSKPLDQITVFQGSILRAAFPIQQTSLSLEARTNAQIDLEVYAERLDTKTSFGGSLFLKGEVTNHEINLATSGVCEADLLKTKQTKIKNKGGAYAYVYASELLDAKMYGGVLRILGQPLKQITEEYLGAVIEVK